MQATLPPNMTPPPPLLYTHTHNKWHCACSKCAWEPTHSRHCCCARRVWAPSALQPCSPAALRFSRLSPPHQPPITQSTRSVPNPPPRLSFWLCNSLRKLNAFSLISFFLLTVNLLFFIQCPCVWDAASSSSRVQRIMALVAGVSLWTRLGLLGAAEAAGP